MLKATIFFSVLFFLVCPGFGQTGPSPSEYAVYGAVLRTIYAENRKTYSNKSEFVIVDTTLKSDAINTPTARKFRNLVKQFVSLNQTEHPIEKKLPPGEYSKEYHLISQADVDKLFLEGKAENDRRIEDAKKKNLLTVIDQCGSTHWRPFYRRFPEASGYYRLSRAAISNKFALVRIKRKGTCSGFDTTYLLQKTRTGWSAVWSRGGFWVA